MSRIVDSLTVLKKVIIDGTSTTALSVSGGVGVTKSLVVGENISFSGKLSGQVRTVAGNTTLADDYILSVTATASITLPDLTLYPGVSYIIVKQTLDTVTVNTDNASDKLLIGDQELTTFSLTGAIGERLQVTSDGVFWIVQETNTARVSDAPTSPVAVGGVESASVSFTSPSSLGGAQLLYYLVTSSPGNATGIGVSSPIIVAGLVGLTPYTFTVKAITRAGSGTASVSSNSVTPTAGGPGGGVPSAPLNVSSAIGTSDTSAVISFTYPVSDGGSPILSYVVTSIPGGITSSGPSSPITITGLSLSTSYLFTVQAFNANGGGAVSSSSLVPLVTTPFPTNPSDLPVNYLTTKKSSTTGLDTWVDLPSNNLDVWSETYSARLVYGNGRWIYIKTSAPNIGINVSDDDGQTWVNKSVPFMTIWSGISNLVYSGSRWMFNGRIYDHIDSVNNSFGMIYSDDNGETWTWNSIYDNAVPASKMVAVGSGTNTLAYSTDGSSWTGIGTSIFDERGTCVATDGTGRWVAGGRGTVNGSAYSSDGISWTGSGNSVLRDTSSIVHNTQLGRWVATAGSQNFSWAVSGGSLSTDRATGIGLDSSGNSYVTGRFSGTALFGSITLVSAGSDDIYVAKLDPNGTYLWAIKVGTASAESGNAIAVDSSGNCYITGSCTNPTTFGSFTVNSTFFVTKLNNAGVFQWASGTTSGSANGYGIAIDSSNNSYVTGGFSGTVVFGANPSLGSGGINDVFVTKVDSVGAFTWSVKASGSGSEIGYGIAVDGSGNIYIAGEFAGTVTFGSFPLTATGIGGFVAKLDSSGVFQWANKIDGAGSDYCYAITCDSSGNSFVTGHYTSSVTIGATTLTTSTSSVFITKLNTSGVFQWASGAVGTGFVDLYGYGITIDSNGNSYVTGRFHSAGGAVTATFGPYVLSDNSTYYNVFVTKLDPNGVFKYAIKSFNSVIGSGGYGIAVDSNGNAFVCGSASSMVLAGVTLTGAFVTRVPSTASSPTNKIAYSDNSGATWTASGSSFGFFASGVACKDYQLSPRTAFVGNRFVAVGEGSSYSMAYSNDGITWVAISNTIFINGNGICYSPNALKFVAVGSGNNTVAYSTNDAGTTWFGAGKVFSTAGYAIAHNGYDMFVAVGEGTNSIAYSYDGVNWTGLGLSTFTVGKGIAYDSKLKRWIANGSGGTHNIAYSDNGTTWTGVTTTTVFSSSGLGMASDDMLPMPSPQIMVAAGSGTNSLAYSGDGLSWKSAKDKSPYGSYSGFDTTVTNRYSGAAYSPTQDRIYFSPYASSTRWQYIDCTTGNVLDYTHGATVVASAYWGAVYSATQNKIYFVPYSQGNQTNWHYLDCATGLIVAYAHGVTAVDIAYRGGVYSPTQDRIYFIPYGQAGVVNWHYINCVTGAVVAYTHGATAVYVAYHGGAYSPNQNRIYFAPSAQSVQTNWHYIDCATGNVVAYTHPGVTVVSSAYADAAYSSTLDRIYFGPYQQSNQSLWHYIDCTNGQLVAYSNATYITTPGLYSGCTYHTAQNRIYFSPSASNFTVYWHYIDCSNGQIVSYSVVNGIVVANGYYGGAYSPNQQRVYFAPNGQANQSLWHFVGTDTGLFASPNDISFGGANGQWVVCNKGQNKLGFSDDGINWNVNANNLLTVEATGSAIRETGTTVYWVATGEGIADTLITTSDAKSTWTSRGKTIFTRNSKAVLYHYPTSKFVAVGAGTNSFGYSTASDGSTWTGSGNSIFTQGWDLAYNGFDKMISVGGPIDIPNYDFAWANKCVPTGGTSYSYGRSVAVDSSGNVYITGLFNGTVTFGATASLTVYGGDDIYIAKMNSSGVYQWAVKAGSTGAEAGLGIAVDSSGNSYVTGSFTGSATFGSFNLSSSGTTDIFITKLNSSGVFQWATKAGGASGTGEIGQGIAVDSSGNSYITGSIGGSANSTFGSFTLVPLGVQQSGFIAKLDTSGVFLWANIISNATAGCFGFGIAIDASNVYVTGQFNGTTIFGSFTLNSVSTDLYVTKLDTNGTYLWASMASGPAGEIGYAISIDGSGNSYVTGTNATTAGQVTTFGTHTIVNAGSQDAFIAKLNSSGVWQWAKNIGGSLAEYGYGIATDSSGNSFVTGTFVGTVTFGTEGLGVFSNGLSHNDIFVSKWNTSGACTWVDRLGSSSNHDEGYGIAVDSSSNCYITGQFQSTALFGTTSLTSIGLVANGGKEMYVAKMIPPVPGSVTNTMAYSGDGVAWIGMGAIFSDMGRAIAYNGKDTWVAVGKGAHSIMYSINNGVTWTGVTGTTIFTEGRGIAFNTVSGVWTASGLGTHTLAHSSDGISWTGDGTSIFATSGGKISPQRVGYALSSLLKPLIAYQDAYITSIASNGNGFLCARNYSPIQTGFSWRLYSTDNGNTWKPNNRSLTTGAYQNQIAYGDGTWIDLISATSQYSRSLDGINWTTPSYAGLSTPETVTYGNHVFVIKGGSTVFPVYSHDRGYSFQTPSWNGGLGTKNFVNITYSSYEQLWRCTQSESLDGSYWHQHTEYLQSGKSKDILPPSMGTVNWVSVGSGTKHTIAYSDNGLNFLGAGKTIFETEGYEVAHNGQDGASGLWVAVGNGVSHSVATSPDGKTWTGRGLAFGSGGYGRSVAYANGIWIIAGSGTTDTVLTSPDGITWTGKGLVLGAAGIGRVVRFGSGTTWLVGGSGTNKMAKSIDDGSTWSSVTVPFTVSVNGMAFDRTTSGAYTNRWVVGGEGTITMAITDDYGSTWFNMPSSPFTTRCNSIAVGQGIWIATGSGTNSIARSTDSFTWTVYALTHLANGGTGAVYGDELWMVCGTGSSSNHMSYWTTVPNQMNTITGDRDANMPHETRCNSIGFRATPDSAYKVIMSSTPSKLYRGSMRNNRWTELTIFGQAYSLNGNFVTKRTVSNGSRWVAIGTGTSIVYSDNCVEWYRCNAYKKNGEELLYNGAGVIAKVVYGNGKWVAVTTGSVTPANDTHHIAYSDDGINWVGGGKPFVDAAFGVTNAIYYSNGLWVIASGTSTYTAYSWDNTATWSIVNTSINTSISLGLASPGFDAIYLQGKYYAASNTRIYSSSDAIFWAPLKVNANTVGGIATDGTKVVFSGGNSAYSNGIILDTVGARILGVAISKIDYSLVQKWQFAQSTYLSMVSSSDGYRYGGRRFGLDSTGLQVTTENGFEQALTSYVAPAVTNENVITAMTSGTTYYSYNGGMQWYTSPVPYLLSGTGVPFAFNDTTKYWITNGTGNIYLNANPIIATNGTLYVGVGTPLLTNLSSSAYSHDGRYWYPGLDTSQVITTPSWVHYNPAATQWVMVGNVASGNNVASSSNGKTWTGLGSLAGGGTFNYVTHNGLSGGSSLWLAIVGTNTVYSSTDATSWSVVTGGAAVYGTSPLRIKYGNGRWVIITGTAPYMAHSSDGLNWTAVANTSLILGTNIPGDLFYNDNNDYWLINVNNTPTGTRYMAFSKDGIIWGLINLGPSGLPNTAYTFMRTPGLASLPAFKFMAMISVDAMMYSYDGINWGATRQDASQSNLIRIDYNNTMYSKQIIAVGQKLISVQGNSTYSIRLSPDSGRHWTDITRINPSLNMTSSGIAYNGSNLYVMTASSGTHYLATSPDGYTWTGLGTSFDGYASGIQCIAHDQSGRWVAGGTSSALTSTNGTTWTQIPTAYRTLLTTWNSIAYGGGLWVAIGTETTNRVLISTDGLVWNVGGTTSTFSGAGTGNNIVYGNGIWMASFSGTFVYTSTNGISWTQTLTTIASHPTISYSSSLNRWIVMSVDNGTVAGTSGYYSNNNGTSWTQITVPYTGLTAIPAGAARIVALN